VQVVSRTSDFVGILSVCLVELAATLVLTEVCFPASFYFHRASSLSPPNNENPYSYKTKRGIRKLSYLPQQCAKLGEKCCQRTSHIRSAGCATISRPFEYSSVR